MALRRHEPDAGRQTPRRSTMRTRRQRYIVWAEAFTTTASVADKMLLIARTTPEARAKMRRYCLSLFDPTAIAPISKLLYRQEGARQ